MLYRWNDNAGVTGRRRYDLRGLSVPGDAGVDSLVELVEDVLSFPAGAGFASEDLPESDAELSDPLSPALSLPWSLPLSVEDELDPDDSPLSLRE